LFFYTQKPRQPLLLTIPMDVMIATRRMKVLIVAFKIVLLLIWLYF